jgi:hypothetical protein
LYFDLIEPRFNTLAKLVIFTAKTLDRVKKLNELKDIPDRCPVCYSNEWRRVKYDKTKEPLHFLVYIYSPEKISKP